MSRPPLPLEIRRRKVSISISPEVFSKLQSLPKRKRSGWVDDACKEKMKLIEGEKIEETTTQDIPRKESFD